MLPLPTRTTGSNSNNSINNNHRRQGSESIVSTERSSRFYKDHDRHLIQYLINEYLLQGSPDVLDLIRNCSNECFEALIDIIWSNPNQIQDTYDDDHFISNQRSSLLSTLSTNFHRQRASRRLAIILIETLKLLATTTINGGRLDTQRQSRLLLAPPHVCQLINFEPDINGLSCLAFASLILLNPVIVQHQMPYFTQALKSAANQFAKANLSFDTHSTFAIAIYSLFYLLYILFPNNLRRELQPEPVQTTNTGDKPVNRLGIQRVLLPLCYHFKLQPNVIFGTIEGEKQESRWPNESWQKLIANGDRYVVFDDIPPLLTSDVEKKKREETKKFTDPNRFEIDQVLSMCNEYAENVLHPSENKRQIMKNTSEKLSNNEKKSSSSDCYSNYSDSVCQTFEQQWQGTIQNGQMNLSRVQTPANGSIRRNGNNNSGNLNKKDSNLLDINTDDKNIFAIVQFQLDMLDCNYEREKREYYAQLIRDNKTSISVADVDKELRNQEIQFKSLLKKRQDMCPLMFSEREQIDKFHQLNEEFYKSLSEDRIKLKTAEDEHLHQQRLFTEKQSKLKCELVQLAQNKESIENEMKEVQRRLFPVAQKAKQSLELKETFEKISIDLACARKKHQLLNDAFMHVKLKTITADKLMIMTHVDEEKQQEEGGQDVVAEKKRKFEELKLVLNKQHTDLTAVRDNFIQTRAMQTHKIGMIRRQIDSVRVCQTQLGAQ